MALVVDEGSQVQSSVLLMWAIFCCCLCQGLGNRNFLFSFVLVADSLAQAWWLHVALLLQRLPRCRQVCVFGDPAQLPPFEPSQPSLPPTSEGTPRAHPGGRQRAVQGPASAMDHWLALRGSWENNGEGRVDGHGSVPGQDETRSYLQLKPELYRLDTQYRMPPALCHLV